MVALFRSHVAPGAVLAMQRHHAKLLKKASLKLSWAAAALLVVASFDLFVRQTSLPFVALSLVAFIFTRLAYLFFLFIAQVITQREVQHLLSSGRLIADDAPTLILFLRSFVVAESSLIMRAWLTVGFVLTAFFAAEGGGRSCATIYWTI